MAGPKDDLEALIAQRAEIDAALREHHSQTLAILFTDIVGSTRLFEQRGDIEGLAMVRRHNAILFPVVEGHGGRVVKTIGDAIMAVFEDPPRAVRCAAEMQRALEAERAGGGEPIHVRIGVHAGRVMLDGEDVFGDAVNTAARVQGKAGGDEVLVSESLFRQVPASDGIAAVPFGSVALKGKAEPLPVVSLRWRAQGDVPAAPEASLEARALRDVRAEPAAEAAPEVFVLDLQLGARGLKVAVLDGAGDKGPVRAFGEPGLDLAALDGLAGRFDAFLGGDAKSYEKAVRDLGRELYETALTERARRHLAGTPRRHLRLHVDAPIAHVPWELMHDGEEHLAVRFAMGRVVSTSLEESVTATWNAPSQGARALVVSNPSGDLPGAAREGAAVAALLSEGWAGEVVHLEGPVDRAAFLAALPGCRILHFAGHAVPALGEAPGGLRLADGVLGPDAVASAASGAAPDLVFANGCHASSARGWTEEARGTSHLAAGLLLRGVRHFLGPVGAVPDEDALSFALRFWEHALAGHPYGEAVRRARVSLRASGQGALSFGRWVLYGEPRSAFAPEQVSLEAPRTRSAGGARASSRRDAPAPADRREPEAAPRSRRGLPWARIALAAGAVAALGLLVTMRGRDGGGRGAPAVAAPPAEQGPPARTQRAAHLEGVAHGAASAEGADAPAGVVHVPHEGPLRIAVLEIKHVGGDADPHLGARLQDTLTTEIASLDDVRLTERAALDYDVKELELEQGRLFDPALRARIGKLMGAEVVVVGGYQQAGGVLRVNLRFVDVETGRVLHAVKVQGPAKALFDLQDEVAEKAKALVGPMRARLRR